MRIHFIKLYLVLERNYVLVWIFIGYTCTQDIRALTTMDKLIDSLLNISFERYIHTYIHAANN